MAQLPADIWAEVIKCLDRNDHKSLRSTVSSARSVINQPVFKIITLRPNADSLHRASSIANDPTLACCVRELNLRAETVFKHADDIARHMKEYCNSNQWSRRKDKDYALVDFELYFRNRPKLTTAEQIYEKNYDSANVLGVCRRFPRLTILHRSWQLEEYLETATDKIFPQQYGLRQTIPTTDFDISLVLKIVNQNQINDLSLRYLPWTEFEHAFTRPKFTFPGLHRLRRLDLKLVDKEDSVPVDLLRIEVCKTFMEGLTMIEEIKLDLGVYTHWQRCSHRQIAIWETFFAKDWSNLRVLQMTTPVTSEVELLAFLSRHRLTLRNLSISNLKLDTNYAGHPPSSIMRALWTFPYVASLDKINMDGDFRSCNYPEEWYICLFEDERNENPGAHQLEEYICRRAPFPFPKLVEPLEYEDALNSLDLPIVNEPVQSPMAKCEKDSTDASTIIWDAKMKRELLSSCADRTLEFAG